MPGLQFTHSWPEFGAMKRPDTFLLGDRAVRRMGFGAMQLAGRGVWGPPADHRRAVAVLRAAVAAGVNHIDTSDYYGPHVVNHLIHEALHPYPDDLVIVTKVRARRGPNGEWLRAVSADELKSAVHDNLRHLGVDVLDVVNMRAFFAQGPAEGPMEESLEVLAGLQQQGLIRHIGLSNVTPAQVSQARRICPIVCVQNHFNLIHRADSALIDALAADGVAYVPFFPLGGLTPLQSDELARVAAAVGASAMQVALAWLLQRAPNMLLIPGTSSPGHLAENLAAASLVLPAELRARLDVLA